MPAGDDVHRISEALQMALRMYELGARGSGRTTKMLERVREGEAVVCLNSRNARHVESVLRDKGLKHIRILNGGVSPHELEQCLAGYRGPIHFTHEWVSGWFSHAVILARNDIDEIIKRHARPEQQGATAWQPIEA